MTQVTATSKATSKTGATAPDTAGRQRGRPREFDCDAVLDKAVDVLTERGYHGTSIGDLTRATGLSQGSLYKAFGDKRGILLAALERWRARRVAVLGASLEAAESGRDGVRRMLEYYANASQGAEGRRGCLIVATATEVGTFDDEIAGRVKESHRQTEALFAEMIVRGQADGTLSPTLDPVPTARTLLCLVQGMRVIAKTGRSREEIACVVATAMQTLT